MQVNNDRALETGLTFRPIGDTARDMIANLDQNGDPPRRGGFDPETEAALLEKWYSKKS